jgi:hypothetical protein
MNTWGSGGIAPPFLTSAPHGGVIRFMPWPPYPRGKSPGPESRSRRCGVEKNLLPPVGNRTPAVQPVIRRFNDWDIPAPDLTFPALLHVPTSKSILTHNDVPPRRCLVQTLFNSLTQQSRSTRNSRMHSLQDTLVLMFMYDTQKCCYANNKKI